MQGGMRVLGSLLQLLGVSQSRAAVLPSSSCSPSSPLPQSQWSELRRGNLIKLSALVLVNPMVAEVIFLS